MGPAFLACAWVNSRLGSGSVGPASCTSHHINSKVSESKDRTGQARGVGGARSEIRHCSHSTFHPAGPAPVIKGSTAGIPPSHHCPALLRRTFTPSILKALLDDGKFIPLGSSMAILIAHGWAEEATVSYSPAGRKEIEAAVRPWECGKLNLSPMKSTRLRTEMAEMREGARCSSSQ